MTVRQALQNLLEQALNDGLDNKEAYWPLCEAAGAALTAGRSEISYVIREKATGHYLSMTSDWFLKFDADIHVAKRYDAEGAASIMRYLFRDTESELFEKAKVSVTIELAP